MSTNTPKAPARETAIRQRFPGRGGIRFVLSNIHPVDKSLLLLMLALLLQSAYSIFFPGQTSEIIKEIDIIVRTSAAAIFGYFLSANFTRRAPSSGQAPADTEVHKQQAEAGSPPEASGLKARIGFSDSDESAAETGTASAEESLSPEDTATNRLQVIVAAGIGLFCLIVLLVLRNLAQWGLVPADSDSVASTVVQFRDFISGCVGFLIGCPTHSSQTP